MPKSNRLLRSTLLDKKPFCKNEGINPATTDASVDNFTFFCGCPSPYDTLTNVSALIASMISASDIIFDLFVSAIT